MSLSRSSCLAICCGAIAFTLIHGGSIDQRVVAAPPSGEGQPASLPVAERSIPEIMRLVADRQIAANAAEGRRDRGWIRANLYPGILATYAVTGDERYLTETIRWATEEGRWTIGGNGATRPARGRRFADNQAIGWTYVELARLTNDLSRLDDVKTMAAEIEAGDAAGRVEWWWCDALNMAPPTLTRLAAVTGDRRYLDLLDRLFWDSVDHLYDPDERLFFRDRNFFEARHEGKKVFWSRGNGWVVSGLARVLNDLPNDHPTRPRYVQLFRDLCTRVAELQGDDGLWRSNLLVPSQFPNQETSGTAFFVFGMAWGINAGLLDRETFEPVVRNGWKGLVQSLHVDGKLGWVQPVGADPRVATADLTQEYAVGAFLLAAQQVMQLDAPASQPTSRPARAHAMFVPQRMDDFAWENDKVAFRAYGPALQKQDGPQSGIDIWVKRVPDLVQAKWYAHGDYHNDNGEGLDGYKVGATRGVGGTAVIKGGKAYPSGNFTAYRIIEDGPDRVVFELDYGPWDAAGTSVKETKRITLPAGSLFNVIQSTFTFDGEPITVGVGLKDKGSESRVKSAGHTRVFVKEKLDGDDNGELYTAIDVGPPLANRTEKIGDDSFCIGQVKSGQTITYRAGGAWSKSDITDMDAWLNRAERDLDAKN